MIWSYFIVFALLSVALWTTGAWAAWHNRRQLAFAATGLGLAVFFAYILIMWITLERPPLRTMGETRLWYSFFLPLAGIIVYSRWQYKWILGFSTLLAAVFVCINLFRPEIHSKTLMPALQSPWFAPHVIVYMMAYALLGTAGRCCRHVGIPAFLQKGGRYRQRDGNNRQSRLRRTVVYDSRYAHGCHLGKRSLGTLLGMGSERDMGRHYLAVISCLYSLSAVPPPLHPPFSVAHHHRFLPVADVLVGNQLPAVGTGDERAYLQPDLNRFSDYLFPAGGKARLEVHTDDDRKDGILKNHSCQPLPVSCKGHPL